jgi:hypothetical protein
MSITQTIMSFVVDAHSYARMQSQDCNGIDDSMQYAAFLNWNLSCINALTDDERNSVLNITNMIKANMLNMLDLESCVSWPASNIYYDNNKKLCIVHER